MNTIYVVWEGDPEDVRTRVHERIGYDVHLIFVKTVAEASELAGGEYKVATLSKDDLAKQLSTMKPVQDYYEPKIEKPFVPKQIKPKGLNQQMSKRAFINTKRMR